MPSVNWGLGAQLCQLPVFFSCEPYGGDLHHLWLSLSGWQSPGPVSSFERLPAPGGSAEGEGPSWSGHSEQRKTLFARQ